MSAIRFYAPAFCVGGARFVLVYASSIRLSRLAQRAGRWQALAGDAMALPENDPSEAADEGIQIGCVPMGQQVGRYLAYSVVMPT